MCFFGADIIHVIGITFLPVGDIINKLKSVFDKICYGIREGSV